MPPGLPPRIVRTLQYRNMPITRTQTGDFFILEVFKTVSACDLAVSSVQLNIAIINIKVFSSRTALLPGWYIHTKAHFEENVTTYIDEKILRGVRNSDQVFFTVLDAVSALVLVIDLQGNVVRVNPAAEKVTGYTIEEAYGKPVWTFLAEPQEQKYVRATFRRLDRNKFPNRFEYSIITRDGQSRQFAWSIDLITGMLEEPLYVVATGVDLTDMKRIGEELVQKEAQNKALLHAIPDLIFRVNEDGVYLDFQYHHLDDLFFPPSDILGKSIAETAPPELAELTMKHLRLALQTGELQVFEYPINFGGKEQYFEARVTVSGEREVIAIVRDVSERKHAENILHRKDAILQVVNFAAERFLETTTWEDHIQDILARLGFAAEVSRVYIFENQIESDGTFTASQRYEWCAAGTVSEIGNPGLQNTPYSLPSMRRQYEIMRQGGVFTGNVKDFPPPERVLFEAQDIVSILIVPVFVRDEWWGFIGLDECRSERIWSAAEVEALRAAASMIGAAVERGRVSRALLATLQISEAAHSAENLDMLYQLIHGVVGELMPARSFYIALYDRETDILSFPYFVDEYDEPVPAQQAGWGLTEYVLRSGIPLLSSPKVFQELLEAGEVTQVGTPSIDWLGAPLQSNGETFGVLVVQSYTPGVRYKESDKQILAFVSTQVATAIIRMQSEQALQRQLEALSVLHAVAAAGAEADDEDAFIRRATEIIAENLFPDNFGILLIDPRENVLRLHPSYHGLPVSQIKQPIPLGKGITGRVAVNVKELYVSDVRLDSSYIRMSQQARSELCAPLKVGDRILGVINAERKEVGGFDKADMRLLTTLGSQMATAIERKRTERALRSSEELYRTLVETSPDGVTLTDQEGRIILCNQRMAEAAGFEKAEDLQGLNVAALLTQEQDQQMLDSIWTSLQDGSSTTQEFEVRRPDGQSFPVELNASLLLDSVGKPNGYITISRDITERKRREQEKEAIIQVAAALRAARTRSEMVPIILHSLMQVLNAESAALVSFDEPGGRTAVEAGLGVWAELSGKVVNPQDRAAMNLLLEEQRGKIGFLRNSSGGPAVEAPLIFRGPRSAAGAMLRVEKKRIGMLWLGSDRPLSEDDYRTVAAVADMAANALHRAALHEQTQRRVQRLASLRAIDMAITASLDLRVALNVLLDQLTFQLQVDACDVLIFNPNLQTLEYSASRGFRTPMQMQARVRLGEDPCGRSILQRRRLFVRSLNTDEPDFIRSRSLSAEAFHAYIALPLIAKGELKGVLEVFHRSQLDPDTEWMEFLETLAGQAAIAVDNASLFNDLQRSNMELSLAYDTTLEGWVHALDLRDQEADGHTQRIMDLSLLFARRLGKTEEEIVHLRRGVLLHDIGKIAIPDSILLKPGPLNANEWEIIRRHPYYAYELLSPITYLRPALDIPYCHHEKWDGSGYPRGLAGEQIPFAARMFSIVEVYDALRSDRPFRKAWAEEQVRQHLLSQAGKHFDPDLVAEFLALLGENDL
jgi:PAS domain S-box-containing protein